MHFLAFSWGVSPCLDDLKYCSEQPFKPASEVQESLSHQPYIETSQTVEKVWMIVKSKSNAQGETTVANESAI